MQQRYSEGMNHLSKGFEQCEANLVHTGLIQGFGAVCRVSLKNETITHASENFEELTGVKNPLGQKMNSVFGTEMTARLTGLSARTAFSERWKALTVFGRAESDSLTVEIEPASDLSQRYERFWLTKITDKNDADHKILNFISSVSGFERIMLYEFLSDGTGCVTGEIYHGEGDRYLGLRYPATDIPLTARNLYIQNSYRYIYDVSQSPVRILMLPGMDSDSLDLTHITLRNVSPFHIEYLKNMGVGCAFSLSITFNGKLIGLFSIHSPKPKFLPYHLRENLVDAVRNYLQALRTLEYAEKMKFIDRYKYLADSFCRSVISGKYSTMPLSEIMKIMGASGLAVNIDGEWETFGKVKINEFINRLKEEKADFRHPGIFSTDFASGLLGEDSRSPAEESAGILCIWFRNRSSHKEIICVFVKPEAVQDVIWGSRTSHYPGNINPVNSFGRWKEKMYLHSEKWSRKAEHFAQGILASGLAVRAEEI